MGDKVLQEADWKKFKKDRDVDDAALAKALAAAEKAEAAGAAAWSEALAALDKQITAFRKACKTLKTDKELAARLDAMDKALAGDLKAAGAAAKNADAGDDDDESPAVLTTKMVPLLRQVRKGETMHTMVLLAGKDTAVMLSRRPIPPARRKLLVEHLKASGSVKAITAQCIFEGEAHTFVVEAAAAGMAKKLKGALLGQTGMKLKVRVRGADPNDVDEDLEGDDAEMAEFTAGLRAASDDVSKSVAKAAQETAAELKATAEETAAKLKAAGEEAEAALAKAREQAAADAALSKRLLELAGRFKTVRDELVRLKIDATPIGADVKQRSEAVTAQLTQRQADAAEQGIAQLEQIAKAAQAKAAGGGEAAIAATVKQLATRFVALRAQLDGLDAYKTPIGDDIRKRVEDVTTKLQARQPDGVAKQLDQLDQIARAIQAKKGGASGAAAQGEQKTKAREAADALLAQLDAALKAERDRLPALTDVGMKTPVEAQLATLQADRDKAAQTAGDDARSAAQQAVLDAVPALAKALDDALAQQVLKQTYEADRAAIATEVAKVEAALKATRDRFKDKEAADFEAALKAEQDEAGPGHWKEARDALPLLKAAAAAAAAMSDEAEAYEKRAAALKGDFDAAKGVVDGGLPDALKRLAAAWTDSGAEVDKCVLDKDWPAALAALEKRKIDVADVLKDLDAKGKPILAALASLATDHQKANKLMVDAPDRFKPAMKPAEQKAVADFDIALVAMNWVDAKNAVDALDAAIKAVLAAQTAWEGYQEDRKTGLEAIDEVEDTRLAGMIFPAGLHDDFDAAADRCGDAIDDADWPTVRAEFQQVKDEAKKVQLVLKQGAAYYAAMKSIGADLTEAYRVLALGDSRLQTQGDEFDRVLNDIDAHVQAGQWSDADAQVLELRDVSRALVDANDELSGRLDFEIELSKISGLQKARATAAHPPPGLAAPLVTAFTTAETDVGPVLDARDFGTVAATTAGVLAALKTAVRDLLDGCTALDAGRKAFEAEMATITELAAARALAKAAPPSLAAAVSAFDTADAAATLAGREGRWVAALADAGTLKTRTTELIAARGAANGAATDDTWVDLQRQLDALAGRVATALAATTVPFLLLLQQAVRTPETAAKAAIGSKDRVAAETALATLAAALAACEKGRTEHVAHLLKLKAATDGDVKTARETRLGSEPLNQLRTSELEKTAGEIKVLADQGRIAEADKAVAAWIDEAKAWIASKDAYDTLRTGAPDKTKLAALNATPGGGVVLDALIANLPPDTTPQSVLKDALQARYGFEVKQFKRKNPDRVGNLAGLKAVDETLPDKSLQALYEMLGDVPMEHIQGKIKELVRFTKDKGGAAYGNKKVYMYCGRPDDPSAHQQKFAEDGGVLPPGEKVEAGCEPANTDPVVYFKFAALHEVGHAEDDAKKYMDKPEMAGVAGWLRHGSDEIAGIPAAHFGYDINYTKAILADKSGRPPAAKPGNPSTSGKTDPEWDTARVALETWCADVRVAAEPWFSGAASKAIALEGRVYQEAYAGDWVSYNLSARAQGITPYQFRAPGEWFAELYAAYYTKKLKPNHPAMAWLSTL